MVSLWPWRSEDASPASFEKTLSALSEKITKAQLQLDILNQRSRRLVALWTLYTSFAYILCTIILALVVGWRNWKAVEYTAVAGSPLIMYLVRTAITTFYSYRLTTAQFRLEALQLQRTTTIDKLKSATKYNTTQQLLEKYGGAAPSPKPKPARPRTPSKRAPQGPQRTGMGPPPTANIQRAASASLPGTPQPQPQPQMQQMPPARPMTADGRVASPAPYPQPQHQAHAEFVPNAFPAAAQYERGDDGGHAGKWYDRILDVLLGEDETSPKNRTVLICRHCRLVNGQAPPGVRRVEEVGEWRCFGCGARNGTDEGRKIVEEVIEEATGEAEAEVEVQEEGEGGGAGGKGESGEEEEVNEKEKAESGDE